MRENWKYQPLGEITTSINGLWKGKKPPFVNVGVIRNANFTKEFTLNLSNIEYLDVEERQYSSRKLQRGDLIVEKSGGSEKQPVGRTILFDLEGEYSVSNFTSILRIKDKTSLLPTFLYKYLLYIYKEGYTKEMQNAATGIHNIIYDKFLSIPIPILSLSEQERIVALLDDQFAKIDALKANAASQLQAAKDLFQSALKEMLTPKEGWEEKELKSIGKTQTGCTPSMSHKEYYNEDYIPFIKPSEINYDGIGGINYDTQKLSKLGAENGRVFEADSIFMVCIGATISKLGISTMPVSCNQQINVLFPNSGYCHKFIYYALLNPQFTKKVILEGTSAQATLPIISKGKWEKLTVFIPSLPEQERIAARLDAISEKVKALQANYNQTITLCNDLKQALLKSIFA